MFKAKYMLVLALLLVTSCGTPTSDSASTATDGQASGTAAAGGDTGAAHTEHKQYSAAPEMTIDPNKQYTATINTTKGSMKAELYAKDAPVTVNNFVFLAREGFYDNVKFHRIIKDFMVQTGDPEGTGGGGPGYQFKNEDTGRDYTRGTLAMANAGRDTNGSQFFIVHQDYPLAKDYTVFGKVTEGLETLDAIANTPTVPNPNEAGNASLPTEDVRITGITIEET